MFTPVFGDVRVAAIFTPVFGEVRVAAVFTLVFGEVRVIPCYFYPGIWRGSCCCCF